MTKQEHTRFVQAVRYSPSGNLFASAGFDGKVYIYDGATSELVGEVGSPAHQGGVYGVSFLSFTNLLSMKILSFNIKYSLIVGRLETRWNSAVDLLWR